MGGKAHKHVWNTIYPAHFTAGRSLWAEEHVWILHFYFFGRSGVIHFLVDHRDPAANSTTAVFLIKIATHAPDITDRSRPTGTC
jgi:hypothetical protein